jgi:hypothetical protein
MHSSIPFTRSKVKDMNYEFQVLKTPTKRLRRHRDNDVITNQENDATGELNKTVIVQHDDKENVFNTNSLKNSPSKDILVKGFGPKTIEISNDEKIMNGAPETDLYDVKLLQDEELPLLDSDFSLNSVISSYSSSTVWAEKFYCVQHMRCFVQFCDESITNRDVSSMISAGLLEIESLRSSSSRNGLYLLRQLSSHLPRLLDDELMKKSFDTLINRIKAGPKFLATEAAGVLKIIGGVVDPIHIVALLTPHSNSKNTDVVDVVYSVICKSLENMDSFAEVSDGIRLIYAGLSSRSISAKECSKSFFSTLQTRNPSFQDILSSFLTESQVSDIIRTIVSKTKPLTQGVSKISQLANRPMHDFNRKIVKASIEVNSTSNEGEMML